MGVFTGSALALPYRLPRSGGPYTADILLAGVSVAAGIPMTPADTAGIFDLNISFSEIGIYRIIVKNAGAGLLEHSLQVEDGQISDKIAEIDRNIRISQENCVVRVDISQDSVAIDGLTEQAITIIQGDTWRLTADYSVPSGAAIEFLVQDTEETDDPVEGAVDIGAGNFTLSLTADQTAGMTRPRYRYNATQILGTERDRLLGGPADIQRTVLDDDMYT